jgi:hypothetical protein
MAYIDGYNLYFGLKTKGWKWAYWLNLQKLIVLFLKPDQRLEAIKYFTSIVEYPERRHKRQSLFLEALATLSNFEIHYGHFLADKVGVKTAGIPTRPTMRK